jgi:polar amino acid transport system substrate-binding protein
MIHRLSLLLPGLLLVSILFSATPESIVYMTEDYPPENYVEEGALKGYAVNILKAMWRKMEITEQPIQVLPWTRAYQQVQTQPGYMLFAMARTPEREKLFQWVGPIYRAQPSLFALQDFDRTVTSLAKAKAYRIGVLRDDIGESLLMESGFTGNALIRVSSLEQLILMLKARRIDMICSTESSLKDAIARKPAISVPYIAVLKVGEIQTWYAFNRKTDPALVARFQKALNAIEPERRAIIRRYNRSE